MRLVEDDLFATDVADLLTLHLDRMRAHSPPGSVHALDLTRLATPDIAFWTVREGGDLLGCGALRDLGDAGEIKSMRTADAHLRRGVGALLVDHMIAMARARGYRRLSLETGSGAAFEPALALYRARGFAYGPAFGDYVATDFNQFLHLDL